MKTFFEFMTEQEYTLQQNVERLKQRRQNQDAFLSGKIKLQDIDKSSVSSTKPDSSTSSVYTGSRYDLGNGQTVDPSTVINTKLKKFDNELRDNYLLKFHPESLVQNYDEIYNLARVVRDDNCVVVDALHRTLPMLTKYEKSRVLGQRAKQINDGATPFVKVPEGVIDGYLIAIKELEEKKIPFIIRRPLPNGGSEYWHLEDLEIIN